MAATADRTVAGPDAYPAFRANPPIGLPLHAWGSNLNIIGRHSILKNTDTESRHLVTRIS